jgi:hypothetical protein
VQNLLKALLFYADPDTYFAIGFLGDPPCGDFIDDWDDAGKPGALARKVLAEYFSHTTNTDTPALLPCVMCKDDEQSTGMAIQFGYNFCPACGKHLRTG